MEDIKNAAARTDPSAYYSALFNFSAIGLEASDNTFLVRVMESLLPSIQRVHYASLKINADRLPETIHFFTEIVYCADTKDPAGGENAIRNFFEYEKESVLKTAPAILDP